MKQRMHQTEKSEKEIKVYICPSCKSLEVGYIFRLRNVWGIIPKMQCKACSYEAMIFPMLVTDEKGLNKLKAKKMKKKNKTEKINSARVRSGSLTRRRKK